MSSGYYAMDSLSVRNNVVEVHTMSALPIVTCRGLNHDWMHGMGGMGQFTTVTSIGDRMWWRTTDMFKGEAQPDPWAVLVLPENEFKKAGKKPRKKITMERYNGLLALIHEEGKVEEGTEWKFEPGARPCYFFKLFEPTILMWRDDKHQDHAPKVVFKDDPKCHCVAFKDTALQLPSGELVPDPEQYSSTDKFRPWDNYKHFATLQNDHYYLMVDSNNRSGVFQSWFNDEGKFITQSQSVKAKALSKVVCAAGAAPTAIGTQNAGTNGRTMTPHRVPATMLLVQQQWQLLH